MRSHSIVKSPEPAASGGFYICAKSLSVMHCRSAQDSIFKKHHNSDILRQFYPGYSTTGALTRQLPCVEEGWHGTTSCFAYRRRRDESTPQTLECGKTRRHESYQQAVRALSSTCAQRRSTGQGQPHVRLHDSSEAQQQIKGCREK